MSDYELHNRLGYRVSRLSRIMQNRLEAMIQDHELTRLMWCVVTGVGEERVNTPSGLADYIGVTRPAASRLLRSLEKKGLVQRSNGCSTDGRSVKVELTGQGEAVLRTTRAKVDELNAHFRGKLPPEQYECLMDALELLAKGEDEGLTDF